MYDHMLSSNISKLKTRYVHQITKRTGSNSAGFVAAYNLVRCPDFQQAMIARFSVAVTDRRDKFDLEVGKDVAFARLWSTHDCLSSYCHVGFCSFFSDEDTRIRHPMTMLNPEADPLDANSQEFNRFRVTADSIAKIDESVLDAARDLIVRRTVERRLKNTDVGLHVQLARLALMTRA